MKIKTTVRYYSIKKVKEILEGWTIHDTIQISNDAQGGGRTKYGYSSPSKRRNKIPPERDTETKCGEESEG